MKRAASEVDEVDEGGSHSDDAGQPVGLSERQTDDAVRQRARRVGGLHSPWRLVKAATAQVVGYDDVGNGVEDELNVVGVGGACLVTVHFLRRALVLCLELCLDVGGRFLVGLLACGTLQRQTAFY